MRAALVVLGLALVCLASGCGSSSSSGRVIVLGLDGVDPQVVDLLLSEGKLPNFARLRQGGAYGPLESAKPLLSPIVWTTIATGKTPLEHGISHFVAVNDKTGEQLPVTSQMRRVKAAWNILSEAGREVAVVGWWATGPAETVRGAIVSDHTCYHFLFDAGAEGSRDAIALIVDASDAQREEAEALAREIEAIAAVAEENAATSQEVSAVVEQQTASMTHVSESSQHLAEIANRLKGAMSRFEL